jgi:hypothetical protein
MDTQNLAVQIVRFVDGSFPGWVECQFDDAAGHIHTVIDKYPIFTAEMLDAQSQYPLPGEIQCEVLGRAQDIATAKAVRIRTPGIESTEGLSEFLVLPSQLSTPMPRG